MTSSCVKMFCWAVVLLGPVLAVAGEPDAVIEVWDEHWTLTPDGFTEYYFKQHVRLNNERAYGEFADPRITYNADTDKLELIAARVRRADGTYRQPPAYSHVEVAPDTCAGWPAFASIRQHLIVMSGIEPGCVVELEYKITGTANRAYLAAAVPLGHQYPVRERRIGFSTHEYVKPRFVVEPGNVAPDGGFDRQTLAGEASDDETLLRHAWCFKDLPAVPDEPHGLPSHLRHGRFAFSTTGGAVFWLRGTRDELNGAAVAGEIVTRLADEWTKDCSTPADKLRAIQKKLAASFNFVELDARWWPASVRPAPAVLDSNYGTPPEADAAFLALARAAGVTVRIGALVAEGAPINTAPQEAFIAARVLLLDADGETQVWNGRHGCITHDPSYAGDTPLSLTGDELQRTPLPEWADAGDSACRISGKVTLDDSAKLSGEVSLSVSGLFVIPEELRTYDNQKRRARDIVRRVLPDVDVNECSVTRLDEHEFAADVKIASSAELDKIGLAYSLMLSADGPHTLGIAMPLEDAERHGTVRLAGAFVEDVELYIEWPEGWTVDARPRAIEPTSGPWGSMRQDVTLDDQQIKLIRRISVSSRDVSPADWPALRSAINAMRTDPGRTLLLHK
ncbi:MAG: DUF3857 domain-containing protein [Phycisphaerae bacterium]|nr:DUF3857 domain-containing protein [Phycisphaerae bacterium]